MASGYHWLVLLKDVTSFRKCSLTSQACTICPSTMLPCALFSKVSVSLSLCLTCEFLEKLHLIHHGIPNAWLLLLTQ